MAWITKQSGTQPLDRRSEPYLSEAFKQAFEAKYAHRYPSRRAMALPLLHAIQDEYNWVPWGALEEGARFLGIEPSELADTASFYEAFSLEPRGKYTIWICQSVSCEVMKSEALIEKLSQLLGIEPGETTPDGRFTLMHIECIGACGGAPCALVNERLHENLSVQNIEQILAGLE